MYMAFRQVTRSAAEGGVSVGEYGKLLHSEETYLHDR